jgi:hypothetical protein
MICNSCEKSGSDYCKICPIRKDFVNIQYSSDTVSNDRSDKQN